MKNLGEYRRKLISEISKAHLDNDIEKEETLVEKLINFDDTYVLTESGEFVEYDSLFVSKVV